ncbi:MAG: 3'(2'),5'-bisphosphate nucleotidase CysQ [Dongiaceae bacterium]
MELLSSVIHVAERAGELVLDLRQAGLTVSIKADGSKVTNADIAAENFVKTGLEKVAPGIPFISEESAAPLVKDGQAWWCVDPVDATNELIRGDSYFSINIALIERERAVLGVIHLPALHLTYAGELAPKPQAWKKERDVLKPIHVRKAGKTIDLTVSSPSHARPERLGAALGDKIVGEVERLNGSYKFGLVAEGSVDFYPRFTRLHAWDVAAGAAIIEAAGGKALTMEGAALRFDPAQLELEPFLMKGDW